MESEVFAYGFAVSKSRALHVDPNKKDCTTYALVYFPTYNLDPRYLNHTKINPRVLRAKLL
jgi:hypothetical protein